jgi:hypothetical protein
MVNQLQHPKKIDKIKQQHYKKRRGTSTKTFSSKSNKENETK